MDLEWLEERRKQLEEALISTQQSCQIITGHLQEVNYQISIAGKCEDNSVDDQEVCE